MSRLQTKGFIMEYDKQMLIDNAIIKSHDAILSAKSNFENGFYSTCQNRLYYAIFYIVTALAYKNNFVTSKHSQLMGWFNKKYIYEKRFLIINCFKYIKKLLLIGKNLIMILLIMLQEKI